MSEGQVKKLKSPLPGPQMPSSGIITPPHAAHKGTTHVKMVTLHAKKDTPIRTQINVTRKNSLKAPTGVHKKLMALGPPVTGL